MKEILFNLALIESINFCKAHDIDPSGTHLVKVPRKFQYLLKENGTGRVVLSTTFYKNSVPTHTIYKHNI